MKVNSFHRSVFHLEPGKGVITKKDYKRELTSSKVPEISGKSLIQTHNSFRLAICHSFDNGRG